MNSKISFIYCSDYFNPNKVDYSFEEEYNAIKEKFPAALFSFEDLLEGKLKLKGVPISGTTVYRGWMMTPDQYESFYNKLKNQGINLINSPEEYSKYHLLPNWYDDFEGITPQSFWIPKKDLEEIPEKIKEMKGSFIVKDYVKSRKHEWNEACFIEDISDKDQALKVSNTFLERQGDDLIGGLVLRRYEPLNPIGYHKKSRMPLSEEYRLFIFDNKIISISPYWTPEEELNLSPSEYDWLSRIASSLESSFVTMDIARKQTGELIVIELGDGQVSGLQELAPIDFSEAVDKAICSADSGLPEA